LKNTTKLFRDFIYNDGSLISLIGPDFRNIGSIREVADRLRSAGRDRKILCEVLLEQNEAFDADEETFDNIRLIRDRGALCVVAGHQVGLMGGQLMIVMKAITVLKLAERLEQELSHPVVPVFWLATDDHDFDEIDHVVLPLSDGSHETVRYTPRQLIVDQAMSDVILDEGISTFVEDVFSRLQDTEFKAGQRDLYGSWYAPGESIFAAFAKCMSALFEGRGLILMNPADPRMRRHSAGIFSEEIRGHDQIRAILKSSNAALLKSGYHVQVTRDQSLSSLFMIDGQRRKLEKVGDDFAVDGTDRRISQEELLALIEGSPEKFSPNVLLRPVVQSALLPALAFVGGPAEIAYFAQMHALFGHFDVIPPVMFPRLSATLIEPKWSKFLEQRNLSLLRLHAIDEREAYLTELLKESFPDEIESSFSNIRETVAGALAELEPLVGDDEGLSKTLSKTAAKIDYEIGSFGDKLFKSHRKAQEGFVQKYRALADQLFPEQTTQERYYSFIYWVNKYGSGIMDRLFDEISADTFDHQTLYL